MTEIVLERRFDHDVETVFAFVTEPANIAKWWGPEGVQCPDADMDFTQPGPWVAVMHGAEGARYKVSGEVVAVDPPNRVEFTWAWHEDDDRRSDRESRVRFEVSPDGAGRSRFTLTHSGFADEDAAANHHGGWTSSLKKLERLLT
ncbi:MAG: SRPBCC domain-containing protein [Pseudomonadota bacterium]